MSQLSPHASSRRSTETEDRAALERFIATRPAGVGSTEADFYPSLAEFRAAGLAGLYQRLWVRYVDRGGHRYLAQELGLKMNHGGRPPKAQSEGARS